jgi:hypothetical protein
MGACCPFSLLESTAQILCGFGCGAEFGGESAGTSSFSRLSVRTGSVVGDRASATTDGDTSGHQPHTTGAGVVPASHPAGSGGPLPLPELLPAQLDSGDGYSPADGGGGHRSGPPPMPSARTSSSSTPKVDAGPSLLVVRPLDDSERLLSLQVGCVARPPACTPVRLPGE